MGQPEFVYVPYVATPPDRLWAALTNSEFTVRYWSGIRGESSWKVGAPVTLSGPDGSTDRGEVLEADPPRRLSYTIHPLHHGFEHERPSRVTFEIEPRGSAVRLALTHGGFDPDSRVLPATSAGPQSSAASRLCWSPASPSPLP